MLKNEQEPKRSETRSEDLGGIITAMAEFFVRTQIGEGKKSILASDGTTLEPRRIVDTGTTRE